MEKMQFSIISGQTVYATFVISDTDISIYMYRLNDRRENEIIDRAGAQLMLYLTCTMISSVELAHY